MFGKSYEAKNILHKKAKRPFAKELVKEVSSGEDLFSALFSAKIKEVKLKVKQQENKFRIGKEKAKHRKAKKKASTTPNISAVEEVLEHNESTGVDKLLDQIPKRQLTEGREPKFFRNVGQQVAYLNDSWFRFLHDDSLDEIPQFPRFKRESPLRSSLDVCSRDNGDEKSSTKLNFCEDTSKFDSFKEQNVIVPENKKESHKTPSCSTPAQRTNVKGELCECSPILPILSNFHLQNDIENDKKITDLSDEYLSQISHFDDLCISSSSKQKGKDTTYSSKDTCVPEAVEDFNTLQCGEIDDQKLLQSSSSSESKYSIDISQSDENSGVDRKHNYSPDPFQDSVSDCMDSKNCKNTLSLVDIPESAISVALQNVSIDPFTSSINPETSCSNRNEYENKKSINQFCNTDRVFKAPLKSSSLLPSTVTYRRKHLNVKFSSLEEVSLDEPIERESLQVERDLSLQSNVSHRFTLRKSHLVVPLQSWDSCPKLSTGFRDAHIAFSIGSAGRNESISTDLFPAGNEVVEHVLSFKDLVLLRCEQSCIRKFSEEYPDSCFRDCKKVGEGVYGEVFSRQLSDGRNSVLKIIPVEGSCKINGEVQKKFEEILSEIVITMELSNLRKRDDSYTSNFPELIACRCVQGSYPSKLVELWEEFHEEKTSENDSPEILPEDQVYIILELANVGKALEGFVFNSAEQAFSAFMQVTYALAVAETNLQFEHRDLHWGNILIQPTKDKKFNCKLAGQEHSFTNYGIQANVIDFTLSRMTFEGCCIYNNLADDPEIFEGDGDYQFDIYRLMRDYTNNCWQVFEPYTNVLWLSYVLDKLVTEVYYRKKTTKIHKRGMQKLQDLRRKILEFKSASDVAHWF